MSHERRFGEMAGVVGELGGEVERACVVVAWEVPEMKVEEVPGGVLGGFAV